jgi:hypothetical protein
LSLIPPNLFVLLAMIGVVRGELKRIISIDTDAQTATIQREVKRP